MQECSVGSSRSKSVHEIVQQLVGQRCWYVSVGGTTWPSFTLVCGEPIPRDMPLGNRAHPEQFRTHHGSVELLVWCAWRLQTGSSVIVSSDDEEAAARALDVVTGTTVVSAHCAAPAWDLDLVLSGDQVLKVFSDRHARDRGIRHNWELWVPGVHACAGPGAAWEHVAV
ncbi:MAG TPA: hypothetical protein VFT22_21385 [Kofleriaceae bacterium]|nr:hypothetical protein [Kofleriaceae bacterium]